MGKMNPAMGERAKKLQQALQGRPATSNNSRKELRALEQLRREFQAPGSGELDSIAGSITEFGS